MRRIVTTLVLLLSLTSVVSPQGRTNNQSWLNGTWEGTGYQIDNNETWTMKLTARGRRYRIEYPSLKCGGKWVPLSIDANRARFIEKITFGLPDCVDKGNVIVERLSRQQIAYRFSNRGTREITASAILNRKRGALGQAWPSSIGLGAE